MRDVYENYTQYKQDAINKSFQLRDYYHWDKVAKRAYNILEKDLDSYTKNVVTYEDIKVSFFDGFGWKYFIDLRFILRVLFYNL